MERNGGGAQESNDMQKLANQSLGNDLWTLASQKLLDSPIVGQEKTVVFVGDKQSGKSSLIAKYLDEPVKDDMKETTALDFRYGIRTKDEKKQKVNIYELGGGRILSNLLSAALTPFSISNTVVCISLDLSNPGSSIDSLLYWLSVVREHSAKAIEELQKTTPAQFDNMQQRLNTVWEKHDDKNKINFSLVPIIIIGTKFDVFANQYESVKKKQLCLALRYIAHSNGCDLVFSSVKEKLPSQLYKAMISRYVFDSSIQAKVERDPNQPLNIYAASDNLLAIGEPEGAGVRSKVSFEKLWQDIIEAQFPKAGKDSQSAGQLGDLKKYQEEKVDQMRKQKDEELEQYKKEIERAKRFESQKAAAGGQIPSEKIVVKRKTAAQGTGGAQKVRLNKQ